MFRFAYPKILLLLVVVLAVVALYVVSYFRQQKRLRDFGDPELMAGLMPNVQRWRQHLKFGLVMAAMVFIIFALARPQYGTRKERSKTRGIEAIFVLDVSNSMLARDIAPNRLDKAKLMLSKLIDDMEDDKVGLIVFAGDAFVQMPISADNVSAKMFLSNITTKSVPVPGTAIGTAIDMAIRSFGEQNNDVGRTIILLTDGENHEDDAIEAAKVAKESGISVNVVGFGSPEGAPIPVSGTQSFWRDNEGNVVVTTLNEQMCMQVAEAGNGLYVRADNSNSALRALRGQIDKMQKGDMEVSAYSAYDEKFYVMAWLALFLLVVEFFVLNRKNKWLGRFKWFDR